VLRSIAYRDKKVVSVCFVRFVRRFTARRF
jgi:hypothetical protein